MAFEVLPYLTQLGDLTVFGRAGYYEIWIKELGI